MPTGVGGNQAFVTERVTEGTSLPVGANLANSFIGVEIQGDTTPYKIDISSLSGRLNITQTILGVIKPKGKGAYSPGTQYSLMDYVDSGNQHYLYIGDTPSTGTPLTDTTKWTPLLIDGVNGTNGTNGTNGINAYTTTSAAFTVPAINSSVTISVVNSAWMVSGQTIFIATAGLYTIASIISATSISATNTGASGNAAAAATISSGSAVSPGGKNGANGISAIATTNAFTQPAINANVTVTVNSSTGFVDKQPLFHDLGGYYIVSGAPPSATTVTLKNLGYAGNIAAASSVGAGTLVPSGIKGLDGSGGGGAVGLKFTLNTTAGTPTAGEIRSTNLAVGGTIAINPTDTQASASDILGRLGVGAIVDLRNSDSKWVRGTVTTAWTALSGSFAIGDVRSAGAIANGETVYLSIASDAASGSQSAPLIPAAVTAIGDSITVGTGASAANKSYAALIAANTGWTLTNNAVGGAQAQDQVDAVYATTQSETSQSIVLLGYNDITQYGTGLGRVTFSNALKSIAAWLSIPSSKKSVGQSSGITYTGTWTNRSSYGGGVSKGSSTASNTASYAFSGSAFIVAYTSLASGTGIFTVAIDGGPAATVTGENAFASGAGRTYAPTLAVFSGLSETTHTAVITVISGNVDLEWLAGVGEETPGYAGSTIYVGNIIVRNSASFPSTPAYDIPEAIGIYNSLIKNAVRDLARIGLRAVYCNTNGRITQTQIGTDNIHPTDSGHQAIASAFIDKIRQTPGLLLNGSVGSIALPYLASSTFAASDGTALVGFTLDTGGTFYKLQSASGNGAIQSQRAVKGSAQLDVGCALGGATNYKLSSIFAIGGTSFPFVAFWVRAGSANSSNGILFQIVNNLVNIYDAVNATTFNSLSSEAFTTPTFGFVLIAVTPTTVSININNGAYIKTITTSLYATNSAVGFSIDGANSWVDNFIVEA